MRVVLTGASGFLGSHLARGLIAAGHSVIAAVRGSSDLTRIDDLQDSIQLVDLDLSGVEGLFKMSGPPDVVIHTATFYGREKNEADEVYESNVRFPIELAEKAAENEVSIFINSDTFYPNNYPLLPAYTRSKKQFADWGRSHARSNKYLFVNLRLWHLYGPGDSDSKFIPFLIKSCLKGKAEIPLTDGVQKRDFIYISDAVQAYLNILKKVDDMATGYHQFDVGTGESISVKVLAELIRKAAGSQSTLLFGAVPRPEGELMDSRADTTALKALGWNSQIDIEEGIKRAVYYYLTSGGNQDA